jgi:hypothetical protein
LHRRWVLSSLSNPSSKPTNITSAHLARANLYRQIYKKIKKEAAPSATTTSTPATPVNDATRVPRASRKRKHETIEQIKEEDDDEEAETEFDVPVKKARSKSRALAEERDLRVHTWLVSIPRYETVNMANLTYRMINLQELVNRVRRSCCSH